MMIKTTDNNGGKLLSDSKLLGDSDVENIKKIANINIKDIKLNEYPNLLVFQQNFNQHHDDIHNSNIFNFDGKVLSTQNIMGFIGIGDTKISIKSRFAQKCSDDFFLHYILQKVFAINLFDLKTNTDFENIFDFLLYLFPYYLKKAINQGVFRKYKTYKHNNSNIKGAIDICRHVKLNPVFNGDVAYNTREYSSDNHVTQLIRHTIEHIKSQKYGSHILSFDGDIKSAISQVYMVTQSYNRNDRQKVINQNLRPLSHPYFYEYILLQKICLQILRYEKLKYGEKKDEIYGILFDGAWLWEEYLATVLKDFIHPKNKEGKGRVYLFSKNEEHGRMLDFCYPDFYSKKKKIVLDAKYKWDETKDDRKQMVVYMHILAAKKGIFILPDLETEIIGTLNGYGGEMFQYSFKIPECSRFEEFKTKIAQSEIELSSYVLE